MSVTAVVVSDHLRLLHKATGATPTAGHIIFAPYQQHGAFGANLGMLLHCTSTSNILHEPLGIRYNNWPHPPKVGILYWLSSNYLPQAQKMTGYSRTFSSTFPLGIFLFCHILLLSSLPLLTVVVTHWRTQNIEVTSHAIHSHVYTSIRLHTNCLFAKNTFPFMTSRSTTMSSLINPSEFFLAHWHLTPRNWDHEL